VLLAWTMAALATCTLRRFRPGSNTFEMGIFVKVQPDIRMTRAAYIAADICIAIIRACRNRLAIQTDVCEQRYNKQYLLPAFHIPSIVEMTGNSS
jgi:hypothetical protein